MRDCQTMQVHVAVAHKIEQWTQESCELRVASCMVIDVAAVYLPNCPSTDHLGLVDAERCDEDGSVATEAQKGCGINAKPKRRLAWSMASSVRAFSCILPAVQAFHPPKNSALAAIRELGLHQCLLLPSLLLRDHVR